MESLMSSALLVINHFLVKEPPSLRLLSSQMLRRLFWLSFIWASALFLCGSGLIILLTDLILTSRDHQQLMISSLSLVGFLLVILSVTLAAWLLTFPLRRSPESSNQTETITATSPVQVALSELIRDFVEERKHLRELHRPLPDSTEVQYNP